MKTFAVPLIFILSCAACEDDQVVPAVQRIDFGFGGGIAGNYRVYTLEANGQLTGSDHMLGLESAILTKKIDPITAKRLMSRAAMLFPYDYRDLDGGSDIHLYLTFHRQGGYHSIGWDPGVQNKIDARVIELYEDLGALLK